MRPLIGTNHVLGPREQRVLEVMLTIICVALAWLLFLMDGYKMVILNLFFLPVALAGFFLGRYRAGVLALFCVVCASCVSALQLSAMAEGVPPLVVSLAITVWAATLGLTALLVGTLSDDRLAKLQELHEAYVGVVEVLTQYLQSAHPRLKARSVRVAELSQAVGARMGLDPKEIDDVRVASLLYDVGSIEVTTKVIRRAVDSVGEETPRHDQLHTFQGMDLMLSLGSVLSGAIPLLLNQDEMLAEADGRPADAADVPLGARIIRLVRAYCARMEGYRDAPPAPRDVIAELRREATTLGDYQVLDELAKIVTAAAADEAPSPLVLHTEADGPCDVVLAE